jgi:ABC-type nitrate/sulfonate/bicarbonate transport system substrate-binding protein
VTVFAKFTASGIAVGEYGGEMILRRTFCATLVLALAFPSLLPAQEKTKFPAGVGTKTLGTSLLWLATKKGFFEDQGLDVQPVLLRGTPIAVQALVGESLYITMGSADAMVSAVVGGADLVSVAGVINGLTQAIVAGKKYKSFKELRGTTIGVQSLASGATTTLKRIFKQNGLDYPTDYKLLAVGGGNFNLAALTSGQVSAAFLVVPLVYAAEEQGLNVLGYYKDYFPNYQLTVMSVKRAWAAKNRPLLVRFLKGRCAPIDGCSRTRTPPRSFWPRRFRSRPSWRAKVGTITPPTASGIRAWS